MFPDQMTDEQFEAVTGKNKLEAAELLIVPPNHPVRTQEQLLARVQFQHKYIGLIQQGVINVTPS